VAGSYSRAYELHGVEIIAVTRAKLSVRRNPSPRHAYDCVSAHPLLRSRHYHHAGDDPWNHAGTGTGITGSPFVSAFTAVAFPMAQAL